MSAGILSWIRHSTYCMYSISYGYVIFFYTKMNSNLICQCHRIGSQILSNISEEWSSRWSLYNSSEVILRYRLILCTASCIWTYAASKSWWHQRAASIRDSSPSTSLSYSWSNACASQSASSRNTIHNWMPALGCGHLIHNITQHQNMRQMWHFIT